MTSGRVHDLSGYTTLATRLAQQALSVAEDRAPHRAPAGERRWEMALALPAARILIDQASDDDAGALARAADELAQTLADPTGKVTDGFGHTRPIYAWLAVHLLGTAAKLVDDSAVLDRVAQGVHALLQRPSQKADNDPRLGVWRRLVARRHGIAEAEDLPLSADEPAPLAPLGFDDLIDAWTYRELVGLHGLHLGALIEDDAALAERVRSAADYHLGHTQPDYTTYQPWGLAAFASDAQTAVFAEQQLHDVATHLRLEGAGGAVLPALLLADAAATMSGRAPRAWVGGARSGGAQ